MVAKCQIDRSEAGGAVPRFRKLQDAIDVNIGIAQPVVNNGVVVPVGVCCE